MSNIAEKCSRGLLAALGLALALAGCGGVERSASSQPAPSLKTLFAKASSATSAKQSAHYALDLTVSIEATHALKNALVRALAANPIRLHLEGDASPKAFTGDGSISLMGQEFAGKILAGPSELYVELLGTWYGTKQYGLRTLRHLARRSNAQQLWQHADELFEGTISDGPTLDDVDTWEFKGTLDAEGIAKVVAQNGERLTAQQLDALRSLQNATKLTVDVGKDDYLVRRADVSIDLDSDALKKLQRTDPRLSGLTALHVSLGIDLDKWGETVTITPPDSYKPLLGLTSFLGLGR